MNAKLAREFGRRIGMAKAALKVGWGSQKVGPMTPAKGEGGPQGAGGQPPAPITLDNVGAGGAKATPPAAPKADPNVISIRDSMGGAGGAGSDPNVISLGADRIKQIRQKQTGGAGAGAQAGGAGSFFGGPQMGDMQKYWQQLLGMSPSQYDARNTAQAAGMGRALKAQGDRRWLRSMFA